MDSDGSPPEGQRCSMSPAQLLLNGIAFLGATVASVWSFLEGTRLATAVLEWMPALAALAGLATARTGARKWVSELALVLNVAAVFALCLYAAIEGAQVDTSFLRVGVFAAGATLAGWNVICLSSPRPNGRDDST